MPRIGEHMVRMIAHRASLAAFLAMAISGADIARARQVGANGPASLPEPAPPVQAPVAPAIDDESKVRTEGRSPTQPAVGVAMPPTSVAAPASESRPLGKPNTMLSVRPVERDANAGESSSGLLGGFDPRRNDFTRVLGALAAVIGLILLAKSVASRYFPNILRLGGAAGSDRPSGVIEVLARYPLPGGGRGQQLIVLKFARRVLLAHQAGSTVRTLSEMTDPNEVAALLARLEAGANDKSQHKFRAALERFEDEHESASAVQSRAGAAVAAAQTEIIDLTRTPMRGVGGVVRARRQLRCTGDHGPCSALLRAPCSGCSC